MANEVGVQADPGGDNILVMQWWKIRTLAAFGVDGPVTENGRHIELAAFTADQRTAVEAAASGPGGAGPVTIGAGVRVTIRASCQNIQTDARSLTKACRNLLNSEFGIGSAVIGSDLRKLDGGHLTAEQRAAVQAVVDAG